jgi:chorismate dehydratase
VIFGRIDYLNLLPFSLFLKRRYPFILARSLRRKGPPSHINQLFLRRKIDAAFISSVRSRGQNGTRVGIVARKEVMSVLALPGPKWEKDSESETSNQLARVLGIQGRTLIGDKALRHRLKDPDAIDLAERWHEETGLPFVFARLCYNRNGQLVEKIARSFAREPRVRIPTYIKKAQAKRCGITVQELESYLQKIDYHIDRPAARGLKRFLDAQRRLL